MTIRSHSVAGERRYADLLGVRVWLLAAAAALVGAMVGGGPDRDRATPWLIAAALLGVVSVRLLEAGAPPSTGSSADTERMQTGGCAAWHPRGHERRQVAGWGLLALGAFAATAATAIVLAKGPDVLATTTWVVALASVALGATLSSARHSERRQWQRCMSALPELTCLAAVVAIAVWLRLPDLVGVPPNVHPDEGGFGNGARQILAGKMPIVFATGWFDVPALSFAISALVMLVFGNDLFGLRMASVIEGALTVVVLYLLGRRLWGARPALVAAALLSIAAWHVHFSRMGSQHMQAPLAILLVLYFLIRGVQDGLLLDWVLCGFAIGLSFEVYYAARVAPVLVLAYLGYRIATEKREFVHAHGLGLLALVFGAIVFVAPMTVVYARDPQTLDSRTDAVAVTSPVNLANQLNGYHTTALAQVLVHQAQITLEAFNIGGDRSSQYNHPTPLLDLWTGALVAMSALAILFRPGDSRGVLLAAWVWLSLLFGSVLTIDAFASQRMLVTLPALMLGAALVVEQVWCGVTRLQGRRATHVFGGIALAVFGLALGANVHDYFQVQIVQRLQPDRNTILASYAGSLQDRYRLYVVGRPEWSLDSETSRFLVPNPDAIEVGDRPLALPLDRIPSDKGVAFLVETAATDYAQRMSAIEAAYPGGRAEAVGQQPGGAVLTGFLVDHVELAEANPAAARD